MAAIISRSEFLNGKQSEIDGFEMAGSFGIRNKKKTKYND
jgi:hypothetical protein